MVLKCTQCINTASCAEGCLVLKLFDCLLYGEAAGMVCKLRRFTAMGHWLCIMDFVKKLLKPFLYQAKSSIIEKHKRQVIDELSGKQLFYTICKREGGDCLPGGLYCPWAGMGG
jgi:hypothetical protein